ncbi:unnamed protein product [Ascophyllum nodosum]
MGQTIGKAPLANPEVAHFANLPRSCVFDLWEAFNDVAEGFGLTVIEFREMLQCSIKEYLGFSEIRLVEVADAVFRTFDDDENELIDALECLATIAVISGMDVEEKIRYLFGIYDFDESGVLSVDETILALRSTVSGLCKIFGLDPPLESELETIAIMAFKQSAGLEEEASIDVDTFVTFCSKTPEVTSWIQFCGAVPEVEVSTPAFVDLNALHALMRSNQGIYPKCYLAGTGLDEGLAEVLKQEEKGPAIDSLPQEPWRGVAALTKPSDVPTKLHSSAPDSNLELVWAFGFNSMAGRGAVHYTVRGEVIFAVGACGVVANQGREGRQQRFFSGHSDTISCLAVHHSVKGVQIYDAAPEGRGMRDFSPSTIVCSGEIGARPRVCVWCTETCQVISIFRGFHRKGIDSVCFSPDGQLIVSVGADPSHAMAVFHWQSRTTLFTAPSGLEPVLDCHVAHENLVVSCGVDHIRFWTRVGGSFEMAQGIFGRKCALQPMLCCSSLGDDNDVVVLTGSTSGHMYVWEGRNCTRCIKAHTGALSTMIVTRGVAVEKQALATGSADGKVQLWTSSLEMGRCIDVNALGPLSPMILSISWDIINHKILVATESCEIYEVLDSDGTNLHRGPLVQGHFGNGVRGLAVHPENPEYFATAGADCTIRVWSRLDRKMVKMCVLDTPAQCIDYNPDGSTLAVGLGGGLTTDWGEWLDNEAKQGHSIGAKDGNSSYNRTGPSSARNRKDGAWTLLREKDLTMIHEARDSNMPISAVRWSPDGQTLAVASEDSFVYLYNGGNFIPKAKCVGHKGPVAHVDFSCDGQFLQCDSKKGGELLFFDSERGDQMPPTSMKDTQWETQSCVLGWPLQGAWGHLVDGCMLTAAARANNGEQLALADGFGRVRLLRYPAVHEDQDFRQYRGHGCPVRNCGFLVDDASLVSSGGRDCAVMLWAFEARAGAEGVGLVDSQKGTGELYLYGNDPEVETVLMTEEDRLHHPDLKDLFRWNQDAWVDRTKNDCPEAIMLMEENADEENFEPEKPWHRAVAAPSKAPPEDTRAPDNDITLEWVHGYRCQDCRNGAMYSTSGDILFLAGSLVVRQDMSQKIQRFFIDHTDEVLCFDEHPGRPLVASGQRGRLPKVMVWDIGKMHTVVVLEGFHRRAVTVVKFSANGRLLATMGADDHHGLAVYDWENSSLICTTRTGSAKTFSLDFTLDSNSLILCMDGTVDFWTIKGGQNLTRRPASLGPRGKRQLFLCQGWDGTNLVVGTYDGHIYRFVGRRLDSSVKAHATEVYVLSSTGEGFVSGGADGYVKIWAHNLQMRHQISLLTVSLKASVRSVSWHTSNDKILVGTAGNELFEFNATSGDNIHENGNPLQRGHAVKELWGLSCNSSAPEFCTVGDDKQLRIWDIYSKRNLRSHALEMPSRAVAYSPDGDKIAVGFGMPIKENSKQFDGKWIVLQEDDFQVLHAARDSQKHITDIKWTSDGQSLGMGAADGKVYVYSTSDRYSLTAVLTTHNSPIVALDFSKDGRYVRSTCQAYEFFSHEASTGMVIPAASRLKNLEWATQTVLFSWASQGIWPAEADGTEVMSAEATLYNEHLSKTVAAGDNLGRIRLFRHPCTSPYAAAKSYRAHAGAITRLRWTMEQSHVISVGGEDRCVMQWRHERDDLAAKDHGSTVGIDANSAHSTEAPRVKVEARGGPPLVTKSVAAEDSDANHEDDILPFVAEGLQSTKNNNRKGEYSSVDRPWVKNMIEPSYAPELGNDFTAPKQSISLKSVQGIRSQGLTRGALAYNRSGCLVYPAASIGIINCQKYCSQSFFLDHGGKQVTALRVSPTGRLVASGETGTRPIVRIWDAGTGVELCALPQHHRQGICSVAFSRDERKLATVGVDADKSVAVWRSCSGGWFDAELQATGKAGRGVGHVFFAEFSLSVDDELRVITGGVHHVLFWILHGRVFNPRMGLFGKVGERQTMLCGSAMAGARFVSGAVSGHLYVWKGRGLEKTVRAHQTCVNSIHHSPGGLVTGGKDGFVKLWSPQLAHLKTFDLNEASRIDAVVPPLLRGVRSVCPSLDVSGSEVIKIAAVTAGSEVYEISRESGATLLLNEGHFRGELWGLAMHPTNSDVYATAGDDHSIRVWSISLGVVLKKARVDGPCRALGWSPNGRFLLIGMGGSVSGERTRKDGAFLLLDVVNMEILYEGRDSRSWIRACCYSPNGRTFALASTDHKIYLYDAESFALKAKARKFRWRSPLVSLDFSEDSHFLQSASEDHHILYHSADDGSPFAVEAQLKHIKWVEYTCPFGWPVQGAWPPIADKNAPSLTSLHRSYNRTLLVTADANGIIKLFRYPVLSKEAGYKIVSGHVGGISCIRFTVDDAHVVSIGKGDRAVFIWKIEEKQESSTSMSLSRCAEC